MKTLTAIIATGALTVLATPAVAQQSSTDVRGEVDIVERNARGQATKVRVQGTVYDVCMNERQDNCIQPRAAGLNFGDRPLNYWPGQPASQGEPRRGN